MDFVWAADAVYPGSYFSRFLYTYYLLKKNKRFIDPIIERMVDGRRPVFILDPGTYANYSGNSDGSITMQGYKAFIEQFINKVDSMLPKKGNTTNKPLIGILSYDLIIRQPKDARITERLNVENLNEMAGFFVAHKKVRELATLIPVHHFYESFDLIDEYVQILKKNGLPYFWWALSPLTASGSRTKNIKYAVAIYDKIAGHTKYPWTHVLGKVGLDILSSRPYTSFDAAISMNLYKVRKGKGISGYKHDTSESDRVSPVASKLLRETWANTMQRRADAVSAIHRRVFGYSSHLDPRGYSYGFLDSNKHPFSPKT